MTCRSGIRGISSPDHLPEILLGLLFPESAKPRVHNSAETVGMDDYRPGQM